MIRAVAMAAACLAPAACSQGQRQAAADNARMEAADTAAPPAATVSPQRAAAGTLSAQVSGLNGDVSGLATRVTDQGLAVDLPADALFDFDKATLTPAAEAELRKVAELIRAAPPGAIRVVGHTDAKGDDAYNLKLSEARARTVAGWFGGQVGVRTRAFEVSGRGEADPIAPNARPDGSDDPAGRTRNRRVEVLIPREGTPSRA